MFTCILSTFRTFLYAKEVFFCICVLKFETHFITFEKKKALASKVAASCLWVSLAWSQIVVPIVVPNGQWLEVIVGVND